MHANHLADSGALSSADDRAEVHGSTMSIVGPDGVRRFLFATRVEEDAAVASSPLKVAVDLLALAKGIKP